MMLVRWREKSQSFGHLRRRNVAKTLGALLGMWLLFAPYVAAADHWGPLTFVTHVCEWFGGVNGYCVYDDLCVKAAMRDTAVNEGEVSARGWTSTNACSQPAGTVDAHMLFIRLAGYRDGVYCGTTDWYDNPLPSKTRLLVYTLCLNPGGSQSFITAAYAGWCTYSNHNCTIGYSNGAWSPYVSY
jgi:hypothetical protein